MNFQILKFLLSLFIALSLYVFYLFHHSYFFLLVSFHFVSTELIFFATFFILFNFLFKHRNLFLINTPLFLRLFSEPILKANDLLFPLFFFLSKSS